jgi:acyl-CoA hydrolase
LTLTIIFGILAPAYTGNVVSVHCALNYVGSSSMEVGVVMVAEDLMTGETRRISSSQVIFVALDKDGRPTPVPPLVPADADEQARLEQAHIRRMRMKEIDEELAKMRQEMSAT